MTATNKCLHNKIKALFKNKHKKKSRASDAYTVFDFVLEMNGGIRGKAELRQDIFALIINQFKRDGFFVEFGATDGVGENNTYLLEKEFGWKGILAEPAKSWHEALLKNRNCAIELGCVWSKTGEMMGFDMVAGDKAGLSTLSHLAQNDRHAKRRKVKSTYKVSTISLLDLLKKHQAPKVIDYLSVDTEGSEYEILNAFDFSTHKFNAITVEHNFTANSERIKKILEKNGYRRVLEDISYVDDWYISIE